MKLNLIPFDDFWLDCYTTILYTVLLSSNQVDKAFIYNNNYRYYLTEENPEFLFKTVLTSMDNINLKKRLLVNEQEICFSCNDNIVHELQYFLNNNKIILLNVDLFYWIKESLHWRRNHIFHNALISDIDYDAKVFHVLDSGMKGYCKHKVPIKDLIKATKNLDFGSYIYDVGYNVGEIMYTYNDVKDNSFKIIESIDNIISNIDKLWVVDDSSILSFGDVVQTNIFSLENRQKVNKLLFQISFNYKKTQIKFEYFKQFMLLENEYEKLKNCLIKDSKTDKIKNKVTRYKEILLSLLEFEKRIWETFLNDNNLIFIK